MHRSGPIEATYNSTNIRKQQSNVSVKTLDTPGPPVTDSTKCSWDGCPWRGPGRRCVIVNAGHPTHDCLWIPASLCRRCQTSINTSSTIAVALSCPLDTSKCGNSRLSYLGNEVQCPRLGIRRKLMLRPSHSRPLLAGNPQTSQE